MKDLLKNHKNYCLSCETKNCYNRALGEKKKDCLEIDYEKIIRSVSLNEKNEIKKTNIATQKAFRKRLNKDFAVNWLVGFIINFFSVKARIGVVSCLGSVEHAGKIINVLKENNINAALIPCKLGGLEIKITTKNGEKKKHPGCNPIAQAKIVNNLKLDAVVMVGVCIGHDMLFIKHCKTYVIPFITKMPLIF
ncbi:MAG: DUF1847 domain-containing protein [Candidatus Omnitrophota bacterium]